jgi:NADH-quinone oxidoreductase subunit L
LIGFWSQDPLKVLAGQKAFVMNRIGDLGFLIAMFIAFKACGTLDLIAIQSGALHGATLTTFGLLIFFACTGKSAQLPLFTWLPDAMAGPTPVSALIHAATMVTSGVYLLARLSGVIAGSSVVLQVIAFTGALTALITAIIACKQSDIKKILAYSTVSQLGFMFAACGVGAFSVAVFHVMTHAFFKALLFLGAGSVIHALHEEQNIFKMGALKKAMPLTFAAFTAGWAAILGLPPFSGFFSKDEIIYEAISGGHANPMVFGLLVISALLTAYYMTRLYLLVFFGNSRVEKEKAKHLHESPLAMTAPLLILALLSLAGGWFGLPWEAHPQGASDTHAHGPLSHQAVMVLSVFVAILGAFVAHRKYSIVHEEKATDVFGIDRAYSKIFGEGLEGFAKLLSRWFEERIIQNGIRTVGALTDLSGNVIRVLQVGSAQVYLFLMTVAILWILMKGVFGV